MKKILIIDDDVANIKLLHSELGQYYQVIAATSGQQGIKTAEAQQPDLILLDIIMPVMNGYDTLEQLNNNPETNHIPVIYLTGLDCSGDEEYGINLGARDYIIKPFNPPVVKARIKTQLELIEQKNKIEFLINHDYLTQTFNRPAIHALCEKALRKKDDVAVLFLNLENFTGVNANYGYKTGDLVLKEVANRVTAVLSRIDIDQHYIGRLTADEFLLVLVNVEYDHVEHLCTQLVKAIKIPMTLADDTLTVSANIGGIMASSDLLADDILNSAGHFITRAKQNTDKHYYIKAKSTSFFKD